MSGNYPPPDNPSGPYQGGPGGYPPGGGSQPPYGGPQQPYGSPQQAYGSPQQPYGTPQQPYPGYGPGSQGPGQPAPPPPGQGSKKPFPLVLVIVGAVVLLLIAGGIIAAVALTRNAGTAGTGPSAPGQSSAPPAASKPSDAVKSYLEALAAGNAETALALGDTAPSDSTFLTNEVLAASNKLAPITDISVPDVNDEYAYQVAASFKLGKQQVDENFNVTKAGDQWKLRDAFNDIDLSFRAKNVPTIINGVQAKSTKIRLFPGAYEFTTGSQNISWGEENVLIIQSPSEYPRGLSDLKATLTDKGQKAFTDAVSASLDKCLKSNKISNPGCPNNVDPKKINSPYKFKDGTMDWEASRKAEALEDLEARLDFRNGSVATAIVSFGLQAEGDCDAPGSGRCTLYPSSSLYPRADMLSDPIKLSWGRI